MPALKTAPLPKILDSSRLDWLLDNAVASGIQGTIWSVGRNAIEAVALPVPMGSLCEITRRGRSAIPAEVIGFSGSMTLLAPLEGSEGISPGDRVRLVETCIMIPVGPEMLGRVFDAAGRAIDDLPQPSSVARVPLDNSPISAMQRPPITEVLTTGVRSIDALLTLGRGQRIGIFAGSGVGKSTLLGMMSRGTDADVIVIGLVGERGREVQEYLQRELDPATRQRCVTVVATSDQPALRRVQAAMAATAVAEYFRDTGKNVLLMMDSVTRFAMAQREIGLAAGEAPTTRGYPPSVFSMLPRLVERSGIGPTGSITGIYTVLVEGDDTNEPISDTLRGLLDGHFVLSRKIAHQGRYPALDVLSSLSRLQTHLVNNEHLAGCQAIRNMLSTYKENEDIITIGAYQRGSNLNVDRAIAFQPAIHQFLAQHARDVAPWKATVDSLNDLARQSQAPVQNIPPAKPANASAAEANRTA
jgi:flagellum-specific ATP synthase